MKLDRLLGILTVLLQNDRVTAPFLADKYEVTRRTIGRDIDALCRAGIPIVTHQGAGGGISIAEGFKLDKTVLTTDELAGIVAALKGLDSVSESSQMERTLDKLGANADAVVSLGQPVVIDLGSHYKGSLAGKIEQIKRAILDTRCIQFEYFYEKGQHTRRIEPYFVIFQWSSWYVFGFCTQRQDWRMFKLNRLWDLITCDESFTARPIPPERRDMYSHMTDEHTLRAIFAPSVKYLLVDAYGPDSFHEDEAGLHFEFDYTNENYVLSWLLGFGDKVKVLSPPELVQAVQTSARKILTRYENGSQ
ncbi:MAG: YafY family transcriptional regulator [Defluviitaleaceae bacterium]|nr:YafY family transcriptional regulator [Defluviitaleaceae bacterium]